MKRLNCVVGVALVLFVLFPLNAAVLLGQGNAEQPSAPQIIAVKFHADWCGFCKAMSPVFTDLENKFAKGSTTRHRAARGATAFFEHS